MIDQNDRIAGRSGGCAPNDGTAGERDAQHLAEERVQALLDNAYDMVSILNPDGTYRFLSQAHERVYGAPIAQLAAGNPFDRVHPDDQERIRALFAGVLGRPGDMVRAEYRIRDAGGGWLTLESIAINRIDHPAIGGVIVNSRDVTERKKIETALRKSEERFRTLIEHATDLITIVDAAGVVRYASPSHRRILGYEPEQLAGRSIFEIVHPDDRAEMKMRFADKLHRPLGVTKVSCRVRHADGSWRMVELFARVRLDDPVIRGVILNARDVTERIEAEEALRHQALHDALTGLPNRALFFDRVEQTLALAHRTNTPLAVFLLDLDRFKEINDTFGHYHGDMLLQQVGMRLRQSLRASDTVARLGGDEFAMLLPQTPGADACTSRRRSAACSTRHSWSNGRPSRSAPASESR